MDYGPHVAHVDLYQCILNRRDLYKATISLSKCSIPEEVGMIVEATGLASRALEESIEFSVEWDSKGLHR